jgi:hypothetical protein
MMKQIFCMIMVLGLIAGCNQRATAPDVESGDNAPFLDIPLSAPFNQIKAGMTRQEVVSLAGQPASQTDTTLFYADLPDQMQEIKIKVQFAEGKVVKVEKELGLQQDYPDLGRQMEEE